MGDDDDRRPGGMQFQQQFDDRRRRGRVEVAGRLVGEHERRLAHDRASDRDALTLPARHLRRPVMQAMTQPHSLQRRDRPSTPVAARAAAVHETGGHVVDRVRSLEQVELLEHEPETRRAQPGQRGV